jgi:transcription-repair coupling factor (superfamily II helicase)
MHFSAPSHPLIYSFLLQREEFQSRKIIVETREQGEKLQKTLEALQQMKNDEWRMKNGGTHSKKYRLISVPTDILEVMYDEALVGIFPIETLDWKIEDEKNLTLSLKKGMEYSEEKLVNWLTDHGYRVTKSDEEHTFFRQGDTVSIATRKGVLLINFFGSTLETLYLGSEEIDEFRLFSC